MLKEIVNDAITKLTINVPLGVPQKHVEPANDATKKPRISVTSRMLIGHDKPEKDVAVKPKTVIFKMNVSTRKMFHLLRLRRQKPCARHKNLRAGPR